MSRTRSRRAGSPTSHPTRCARSGLLQTLDDVPAEGAGRGIEVGDPDIPRADVESHVSEGGHHAVARVLARGRRKALLAHPVDPRGRVVRVLGHELVEVLALSLI